MFQWLRIAPAPVKAGGRSDDIHCIKQKKSLKKYNNKIKSIQL